MIGLLLALICLKDVPHTHGTDGLMGRRVYLNSANAVGRTAEQKELKLGDRPEDSDEVLHLSFAESWKHSPVSVIETLLEPFP